MNKKLVTCLALMMVFAALTGCRKKKTEEQTTTTAPTTTVQTTAAVTTAQTTATAAYLEEQLKGTEFDVTPEEFKTAFNEKAGRNAIGTFQQSSTTGGNGTFMADLGNNTYLTLLTDPNGSEKVVTVILEYYNQVGKEDLRPYVSAALYGINIKGSEIDKILSNLVEPNGQEKHVDIGSMGKATISSYNQGMNITIEKK